MQTQYIILIAVVVLCICISCFSSLSGGGYAYYATYLSGKPEVFYFGTYTYTKDQAAATCKTMGAEVATLQQLKDSHAAKANWCATGWVADANEAHYPITTQLVEGCSSTAQVVTWTPADRKAGVNCYGVKPPKGTKDVKPFNDSKWSQYDE